VFNANQVDGFKIPEIETSQTTTQLDNVEVFIKKTGARILYRDSFARYQPITDLITMPDKDSFVGTETSTAIETYYGTILHELAHWTGHNTRLDRIISSTRFGSESYAIEELIAELTAAYLCVELGVSSSPRQDHVNYIASWLKVLKKDNKAIFYAARQAAVAAEYLKAQQVTVGNYAYLKSYWCDR
jgi:antirestriction protein ArdC